jgi:hypothetical protein
VRTVTGRGRAAVPRRRNALARPPAFTGTSYSYPASVDALVEEIKEHTPTAWGPEDREWGTRELGLQDPNGYFLTFTQPG